MNDDNTGASGNRWEPTEPTEPPADQPTNQETSEPAPAQLGWVPPSVPEYAAAEPPAPRTPLLTRARLAVAGGAAAVLIAGGVGGYALGHGSADGGDDRGRFDGQGVPSDHGPGQGQPPGVQVPDRGGADDDQQNPNGSDSLDS